MMSEIKELEGVENKSSLEFSEFPFNKRYGATIGDDYDPSRYTQQKSDSNPFRMEEAATDAVSE